MEFPGPHTICDIYGITMLWSDMKSGTTVKIKALHLINHPGYKYLYASVRGRYHLVESNWEEFDNVSLSYSN